MIKPIFKYFLVVSMILDAQGLFAQTASKGVESTANTQNGASVKDGADKTASANKSAQLQQYLSGAMMFAMAYQQKPPCYDGDGGACALMVIYTGMGILSMAQGNEHGSVASSAGYTGFQSDGLGNNPYDYGAIDLNNAALKADASAQALKSNLKGLESSGIYNSKTGTITGADGKSYKASDFASLASMTAAGIPNGAALGAIEAYKKVQAKAASKLKLGALTAASGFDEGGGGGKGGAGLGAGDSASSGYGVAAGGIGAGKSSLDRDPSSLAGMQKNYNGEPIGVAADSIFLMMTRRYKVKESQESFYSESN